MAKHGKQVKKEMRALEKRVAPMTPAALSSLIKHDAQRAGESSAAATAGGNAAASYTGSKGELGQIEAAFTAEKHAGANPTLAQHVALEELTQAGLSDDKNALQRYIDSTSK